MSVKSTLVIFPVGLVCGSICFGLLTLLTLNVFHPMDYLINDQKVPDLKEGMCLVWSSSREFTLPDCDKIMIVEKIGKKNVLLLYKDGSGNTELTQSTVRRAMTEVECDCQKGGKTTFK
jgi:hypothetical protein